ncbi:MAG: hypothetical protein ACE5KM_16400 [Planctomycetaceae bacterium]
MVRETRFSWNDADDEGFALRRPDFELRDDEDFDFDEFDPRLPGAKRRRKAETGGRDPGEPPDRPDR